MTIKCRVNYAFQMLPSERKKLHCTLQQELCTQAIKLSSPTHPAGVSTFWKLVTLNALYLECYKISLLTSQTVSTINSKDSL